MTDVQLMVSLTGTGYKTELSVNVAKAYKKFIYDKRK